MNALRVLVVETTPGQPLARRLHITLERLDRAVPGPGIVSVAAPVLASAPEQLRHGIREGSPQILAVCVAGNPDDELEPVLAAAAAARDGSGIPILVAGAALAPEDLCRLVSRGVADFVLEPFSADDLVARLLCLARIRTPVPALALTPSASCGSAAAAGATESPPGLEAMLGAHPDWVREISKLPQFAHCHANVLILGETGTGKELCARAIHQLGPRRNKPFAPLNCGAIPTELVENELFGHARGAFTGAATAAAGIVQSAEGGTLFLDEIDALPCATQVKLLRFLQTREYRPVGHPHFLHADVRVVAASNANLADAMRSGRFRTDLFYRLNVLHLHLPPLRARTEDIPLLAEHFVHRFAVEHGKPVRGLAASALPKLLLHDWPGNVRELENVIERAVVVARTPRLESDDISLVAGGSESGAPEGGASFKSQKARAVAQFERTYLRQLLAVHDGNITRAARAAQKNRRAFWELLRKHRLRAPEPDSGDGRPPR